MALVTLQELLQPQLILDLVSRVRPGQGKIGKWLGFQPNKYDPESVSLTGPATMTGNLRYTSYRIFNAVRTLASGRAPAVGPGVIPQNPMGAVNVTCARFHEKIPLNYEYLSNLSTMVGPNTQIDQGGQSYIKQQTTYLATRVARVVEMMSAAVMRGKMYLIQSGDTWYPSFTAPTVNQVGMTIDFQIPAGNKGQLNMLGAGNIITVPWSNTGAPILRNLASIKAAYAQLHGYPLTDAWLNSTMWPNIMLNTEVRNAGGSANTTFAEYDRIPEKGMDGENMGNEYVAVLRADPTIRWHICDDIVAVGGNQIDPSYSYSTATAEKLIPDNMVIFSTNPSPEIAKLYLGGEIVVENPGQPGTIRSGHYMWHEYVTQPSAIDLISLLNAVPCLFNPLVFAPATVSGF